MYYQREKPIHVRGEEWKKINRKDKKALVKEGRSHAILVYSGNTPVGWSNTALAKNSRELTLAEATRRSVHRRQTRPSGELPVSSLTKRIDEEESRSSLSKPPWNRLAVREVE